MIPWLAYLKLGARSVDAPQLHGPLVCILFIPFINFLFILLLVHLRLFILLIILFLRLIIIMLFLFLTIIMLFLLILHHILPCNGSPTGIG